MATIAVLLDLEEGHTLPIFSLLRRLRERGHRICCLGLKAFEECVLDSGFEFVSIMDDILPPERWRDADRDSLPDLYFGPLVRGEVLDGILSQSKYDLVIVHSYYYLEGLVIHYHYRLPIVFFSPMFRRSSKAEACRQVIGSLLNRKSGVAELLELLMRAGVRFGSLADIAKLVLRFPELMILPEEFDLPGRAEEPGVYYVGAGVDLERAEAPYDWTGIDPQRPLIYSALGSQGHLRQDTSRRFYRVVLDTAKEHSDWQFIIAIGKMIDGEDLGSPPDNVALRNWAPQLEILSRSTIMINHAGFGSIKECILLGVPMLVFPLLSKRDHGACADRVVYHGLGLRGDIELVSPTELGSLITQVITDQSFRQSIQLMQAKLKRHDRLEIGVKVIERVASGFSGVAFDENCG